MQYDTDIYADRIGYALYYYRKEEEVSQGRLLRRREREEMVVGPSLLLLSLFVLCRKEGGSDVTVGALSLLSIWMVLLCLCMEGGRMDVKTKDESREEGGRKGVSTKTTMEGGRGKALKGKRISEEGVFFSLSLFVKSIPADEREE